MYHRPISILHRPHCTFYTKFRKFDIDIVYSSTSNFAHVKTRCCLFMSLCLCIVVDVLIYLFVCHVLCKYGSNFQIVLHV